jgi:tetratricopeptide (TPR) repeat protein
MKQIISYAALVALVAMAGCGLMGDRTTNGFNEVLYKPPFKTLSDSIDKSPDNAVLLLRRAERLSQNNQQDIAYYDYKKSWQLQPDEQTAILYAANLFITGRSKDAVALLDSCVQKYPNNPEFKRRLAEAYTHAGDSNAAIALYDNMIKSDSANYEALYEKGILLTRLKDTVKAVATLEKAWRQQPNMETGLALANLYAETKNEKAITLCDALQKRDSAHAFVDPVFLKGVYYSNIKDYPRAVALFDECMRIDWKFIEPYLEKGIILYEQKNYDEAIKTFQYASKINYTNADAYYWTARCYEAIGKKEEALDYYYQAVTFDRNFTEAKEAIKRLKSK